MTSGESTAIVAELPSGRTTLIRELQQRLLARDCHVAFIDVQTLDAGTTPDRLWSAMREQFGGARASGPSFRGLERQLGHSRKRHVLLIRELQRLVYLDHFRNSDPWGKLRALMQMPRFALVATSRIDLVSLTTVTRDWMQGSPFFNTLREMVLGPLTADDAEGYLRHYHPGRSDVDVEWIIRCTGGHPKLLRLLAETLDATSRGESRANQARLHAIVRCRQELRVVLQNAWLTLPWQERWILLCTAIAQRCEAMLSRPSVMYPATVDPTMSHGELLRLLQTRLHRDDVRPLLLDLLPGPHLDSLPGAAVSDLAYFTEVTEFLVRRQVVAPFLQQLRRRNPDFASVGPGHAWDVGLPSVGAPWQPTAEACDRLTPRGILASTSRIPGWEVTPPLFYWWILDQVETLAVSDVNQWLDHHQLGGHVSPHEAQVLRAQIDKHDVLLRRGTMALIEGSVHGTK